MNFLTPLLFLKIKNADIRILNWWYPIIISALLTYLCIAAPVEVNVFGQNGLIKSINGLLTILVGFFIAALTATVSFPSGPGAFLDQAVAGKPFILTRKISGDINNETLSRRRFLCLLFGFNAFSSLLLYLGGELAYLFADNIRVFLLSVPYLIPHYIIKSVFLAFYFVGLSNLFLTTLIGLHYLTDRMHRP